MLKRSPEMIFWGAKGYEATHRVAKRPSHLVTFSYTEVWQEELRKEREFNLMNRVALGKSIQRPKTA